MIFFFEFFGYDYDIFSLKWLKKNLFIFFIGLSKRLKRFRKPDRRIYRKREREISSIGVKYFEIKEEKKQDSYQVA